MNERGIDQLRTKLRQTELRIKEHKTELERLRERIDQRSGASNPVAVFRAGGSTGISGTLSAGAGLTGGGSFPGSVSVAVGQGNGITVNANDVALGFDKLSARTIADGDHLAFYDASVTTHSKITFSNFEATLEHDKLAGFDPNEHIDHTTVTITAGVGLSGGGDISASRTLNLDINGLAADGIAAADTLAFYDNDGGDHNKIAFSDFESTLNHDNLAGFDPNEHIDHTAVSVIAGDGLAGGGTIDANVTLNVGAGDGIAVNANNVEVDVTFAFGWQAQHTFQAGLLISDNQDLVFGDDSDGTIRYDEAGDDRIEIAGADWYWAVDDLEVRSANSNKPRLTLATTEAAAECSALKFHKLTSSPADNDDVGIIEFWGRTSVALDDRYGYILVESADVTATDVAGAMTIVLAMDVNEREFISMTGYNGSVGEGQIVLNENGADIDFRLEASGVSDALAVEGSSGWVGIHTTDPKDIFEVVGDSGTYNYSFFRAVSAYGHLLVHNSGCNDYWTMATRSGGQLDFAVSTSMPGDGAYIAASSTVVRITDGGHVGIGLGSTDPSSITHICADQGEWLIVEQETAYTTSNVTNIMLQHNASGTPGTNFGVGIRFQLESSTTEDQDAGRISAIWSVATHASRRSHLEFSGWITSTECTLGVVSAPNAAPGSTGNARGEGSVELQPYRVNATEVASGSKSTICGGSTQTASGTSSGVFAGASHVASGDYAVALGGYDHTVSGDYAVAIGGNGHTASGDYSFAAGNGATASHDHSFVWGGDATSATISWGTDTVTFRCHGGAKFYSAAGTGTGVHLVAGDGSWTDLSSRRAVKRDFRPVDHAMLLREFEMLPIETWERQSQAGTGIRHIGPCVDEFNPLLEKILGGRVANKEWLHQGDEVGVSLAVAQALLKRVVELEARVASLERSS